MIEYSASDRIAFWLLPAEGDHVRLGAIITQLAQRFNTPVFHPHMTLQVVPAETAPEPTAALEQFCRTRPELTLRLSGQPQWSPTYNRALTLPITSSAALVKIVSDLNPRQQLPADFRPHISLLYGNLDQKSGSALANQIEVGKNSIVFDRIAAIRIGPQTTSAEDVNRWQTVAAAQLQPKES